jgi:hypothetical protein
MAQRAIFSRFGPPFMALAGVTALLLSGLPAASASATTAAVGAKRPACTITGTIRDDVITGTGGPDVICGLWGRDEIHGLGGDDIVYGGPGDDIIFGGAGDDKLNGGTGDDVVSGGEGDDFVGGGGEDDRLTGGAGKDTLETRPLSENPPWSVLLITDYDLPKGSTIVWSYEDGSGECMTPGFGWTDTAGAQPTAHTVFNVSTPYFWDPCAVHRSKATWHFLITLPSGVTKNGNMLVTQGPANLLTRTATATCSVPEGTTCSGGDGSSPAPPLGTGSPRIGVYIGPVDDTPDSPPSLQCGGPTFTVKAGIPLDHETAHVCSLNGYPRPTFTIGPLPPGVTASRWPSYKDGWIVLGGTPTAPWGGVVSVTASLPGGWSDTQRFALNVVP